MCDPQSGVKIAHADFVLQGQIIITKTEVERPKSLNHVCIGFGMIRPMSDQPQQQVTIKFIVNGQEVGMLMLSAKTFSTGSTGFFGNGKILLGDDAEKGYQAQVQLVKIGSAPAKK